MEEYSKDAEFLYAQFPAGFAWGTATAAYQVEGAWNVDGRGESIWDRFCHQPGKIKTGETGDDACKSYYKFPEDIRLMKELGVSHYRFSISWPRILPSGRTEPVNPAGIDYYNRLIDALLEAGITPVVTLYHWDLPQQLHDEEGGWAGAAIVQRFVDYARVCFRAFGDRVKTWITLNEPYVATMLGYGMGMLAPGVKEPWGCMYRVGHHMMLAHVAAYRMYDEEFRHKQGGEVGLTVVYGGFAPLDPNNASDVAAAERAGAFHNGWLAQPVYGNGDYPELMKDYVAEKAKKLGLASSPLPSFSAEEMARNKGSYDFVGLNYYTSRYVSHKDNLSLHPTQLNEMCDVTEHVDPGWKVHAAPWIYVVPSGLRAALNWLRKQYGNPKVYITENGMADDGSTLNDTGRIDFYTGHLNNVLKAILKDSCNVYGYFAWSLMDNFEWFFGYSLHFGLHHVDFTDAERPRTAKASAAFYRNVVNRNGFIETTKL